MASPKAPSRAAERAAHWCVDLRTMQRWLARTPPVPVDDDAAMIRWVAAQPSAIQAKLAPRFRARIDALRVQQERRFAAARAAHSPRATRPADPLSSAPPAPGAPPPPTLADAIQDPDYATFRATHATTAPSDTDTLARQRLALSFATYKLELAQARGDLPAIKDATEALRHISGVIRADELAAQRLNREIGDTLPRADAARLIRALPYWLLRGIDALHAALDRPLAAAASAGPLLPESLRTLLEPHALAALLHAPLVRAAQVTSPNALPRWALDEFRAAHAATLEDGARLFDELYATPVPPPAPPSQISNPPPISNSPIIQAGLTEALSAPPASAIPAPKVSATPGQDTPAPSISSRPDLGSGPAQTAGEGNNFVSQNINQKAQ